MSGVTLSRPDVPIPEDSVATLRAFLESQRYDIVAAYHVVEKYPADGEQEPLSQETLMFELRDPPDVYAGKALFMIVGTELPPLFPPIAISDPGSPRSVGFTFAPKRLLPAVRAAGEPLWIRDDTQTRSAPVDVELVLERPAPPYELLDGLRSELSRWDEVTAAYLATERLLKDNVEVSSRTRLIVQARVDSRDASRRLWDSVRSVIGDHFSHFGMSIVPDGYVEPELSANGLVVFERAADR